MIEPTARFPVVCPKCAREKLTEFPVNEVAYALNGCSDITLVAACHEVIWTATEQELEQIHEYLLVLKGGWDKRDSIGEILSATETLLQRRSTHVHSEHQDAFGADLAIFVF
jgi:hypothetical protein